MNDAALLHLLIGIVLAALGIRQFRRRRSSVLGWLLCAGGAAFAATGLPAVHHLLFH
jgi:hypothetical protein